MNDAAHDRQDFQGDGKKEVADKVELFVEKEGIAKGLEFGEVESLERSGFGNQEGQKAEHEFLNDDDQRRTDRQQGNADDEIKSIVGRAEQGKGGKREGFGREHVCEREGAGTKLFWKSSSQRKLLVDSTSLQMRGQTRRKAQSEICAAVCCERLCFISCPSPAALPWRRPHKGGRGKLQKMKRPIMHW